MSGQGEEFQPGNDSGQRGQWQQRAEGLVFFAVLLLAAWLTIMTYNPKESAQRSLAYGVGMYAVVVVAALLLRVVARLSLRPLKLVLAPVLFVLLMLPPFFGSMSIASGFIQLIGNRSEHSDFFLGFFLWVFVCIPVALFIHRTTTRV
jgi:hypothetical protein